MYSFGVLVLEVVTGKRPTDDMFSEGLNLQGWVKSHMCSEKLADVIDPSLLSSAGKEEVEEEKKEESLSPGDPRRMVWEVAIVELIELGILCTQGSPSMRPTMLDVSDDLDRLKRYLSGDASATCGASPPPPSSGIPTSPKLFWRR